MAWICREASHTKSRICELEMAAVIGEYTAARESVILFVKWFGTSYQGGGGVFISFNKARREARLGVDATGCESDRHCL